MNRPRPNDVRLPHRPRHVGPAVVVELDVTVDVVRVDVVELTVDEVTEVWVRVVDVNVLEVAVVVLDSVVVVDVDEDWQIETKSSQQSSKMRHETSHWHAPSAPRKFGSSPQPRTRHSRSGGVAVGAAVVGAGVGVSVGTNGVGAAGHPEPSPNGTHVGESTAHD